MGKIFNIAGPCNPEDHYMLPATERIPEVMRLVEDKAYFFGVNLNPNALTPSEASDAG